MGMAGGGGGKSDLEKKADELYNRAMGKQRPSTAPQERTRRKKWVSPGPGAYDIGVSKVRQRQ